MKKRKKKLFCPYKLLLISFLLLSHFQLMLGIQQTDVGIQLDSAEIAAKNNVQYTINVCKSLLAKGEKISEANISRSYYILGKAFQKKMEYDSASHYLNKALSIKKGRHATIKLSLALNYKKQGKLKEAIKIYKELLSTTSRKSKLYTLVLNALSQAYKENLELEKAIELLKDAIKIYKNKNNRGGLATSYNLIGSIYLQEGEFVKAFDYYNQSLVLRREIGDSTMIANQYDNIGLVFYNQGSYDDAIENYFKALNYRDTLIFDTDLANTYNYIGNAYFRKQQGDKARKFYNKSLYVRMNLNLRPEIAKSYLSLARISTEERNLDSSVLYLQKALKIWEQQKHYIQQGRILNELGNIYLRFFKYVEALESYLRAIKVFEKKMSYGEVSRAYVNVGLIHSKLNRNEKATEYFDRALTIERKIKNKKRISYILNIKGNQAKRLGKNEEAIGFYKDALALYKKMKDKKGVANVLINLGDTYFHLHKNTDAVSSYLKALKLSKELNDYKNIANVYNSIGNLYSEENQVNKSINNYKEAIVFAKKIDALFIVALCNRKIGDELLKVGKPDHAYEYFDRALKASIKFNDKESIKNIYHSFYLYYFVKKDYQKALNYYKLFSETKDSIIEKKYSEELLEKQIDYEIEQRKLDISKVEGEVEVLRKDKELQALIIQRQKTFNYFLFIFVVLVAFIAGMAYILYASKRKANQQLKDKNEELGSFNERLQQSESKQKQLNSTKDKLFSIIGHDLKGPISAIIGFSELLIKKEKTVTANSRNEYISIIHSSSKLLNDLLENLLHWARAQTKNMPFKPERLSLQEIIEENVKLLSINATNKDIKLQNNCKEEYLIFADDNMIKTVVRNLVSNAIKFSKEGGIVKIEAIAEGHFVEIKVCDNGVGIKEEDLKKLFDSTEHFSTKGTSNEKGSGLGLILCKEFVEKNGGKIKVESVFGEGTIFTFTVRKSVSNVLIEES